MQETPPAAAARAAPRRGDSRLPEKEGWYYWCLSESKTSKFRICPNSGLEIGRTKAHNFGQIRTAIKFGHAFENTTYKFSHIY